MVRHLAALRIAAENVIKISESQRDYIDTPQTYNSTMLQIAARDFLNVYLNKYNIVVAIKTKTVDLVKELILRACLESF
jgi:hypothetical protein